MDFVEWCGHVLNKIIEASVSPEALSHGYLSDDLLARVLLGQTMQSYVLFITSDMKTWLQTGRV